MSEQPVHHSRHRHPQQIYNVNLPPFQSRPSPRIFQVLPQPNLQGFQMLPTHPIMPPQTDSLGMMQPAPFEAFTENDESFARSQAPPPPFSSSEHEEFAPETGTESPGDVNSWQLGKPCSVSKAQFLSRNCSSSLRSTNSPESPQHPRGKHTKEDSKNASAILMSLLENPESQYFYPRPMRCITPTPFEGRTSETDEDSPASPVTHDSHSSSRTGKRLSTQKLEDGEILQNSMDSSPSYHQNGNTTISHRSSDVDILDDNMPGEFKHEDERMIDVQVYDRKFKRKRHRSSSPCSPITPPSPSSPSIPSLQAAYSSPSVSPASPASSVYSSSSSRSPVSPTSPASPSSPVSPTSAPSNHSSTSVLDDTISSKRPTNKACKTCHKARQKCTRSRGRAQPCDRCLRLGKDCQERVHLKKGRPRKGSRARSPKGDGSSSNVIRVVNCKFDLSGLSNLSMDIDPANSFYCYDPEDDLVDQFMKLRVSAWRNKFTQDFLGEITASKSKRARLDVLAVADALLRGETGMGRSELDNFLTVLGVEPAEQSPQSVPIIRFHDRKSMDMLEITADKEADFDDKSSVECPADDWPVACGKVDARYSTGVDQAPIIDFYVYTNKAFHHLFGMTKKEVIDMFQHDKIPMLHRTTHYEDWPTVFDNLIKMHFLVFKKPNRSGTYSFINRVRHKAGPVIATLCTGKVTTGADCQFRCGSWCFVPIPGQPNCGVPHLMPNRCQCTDVVHSSCFKDFAL